MHYRTGLSHYFGGNAIYLEYIVYCILFYCILFRACSHKARYLGGHGYLGAQRYPDAHLFLCFESLFVYMHETGITRLDYSGVATPGHAGSRALATA